MTSASAGGISMSKRAITIKVACMSCSLKHSRPNKLHERSKRNATFNSWLGDHFNNLFKSWQQLATVSLARRLNVTSGYWHKSSFRQLITASLCNTFPTSSPIGQGIGTAQSRAAAKNHGGLARNPMHAAAIKKAVILEDYGLVSNMVAMQGIEPRTLRI